jgi:hypothetical protein
MMIPEAVLLTPPEEKEDTGRQRLSARRWYTCNPFDWNRQRA